jgi:hypothetical protein
VDRVVARFVPSVAHCLLLAPWVQGLVVSVGCRADDAGEVEDRQDGDEATTMVTTSTVAQLMVAADS